MSGFYFFAPMEQFLFELKESCAHPTYHPLTEDMGERYEAYSPCSDQPQFWPSITLAEG